MSAAPAEPGIEVLEPAGRSTGAGPAETLVGMAPRRHVSLARRALANGAVRVGGIALALLILAAIAAPWLGTIDPTLIDPASRNLLPGTRRRGDEPRRRQLRAPLPDGQRQPRARHLQPRAVRRPRLDHRRHRGGAARGRARHGHRPRRRLLPPPRRRGDAPDGRADGDPRHPVRDHPGRASGAPASPPSSSPSRCPRFRASRAWCARWC